nr:NAD(P)H-dependent oxidoreductase [uncultured Blautia sp.]
MKITVIHGQNHKGNTYMIAHELAEKIGGEVTEFFLPRDFDEPCIGCWTCFNKDLTHCPHYKKLKPLMDAMDEADVVILASPVYVYHATGQMMAFLDHFGTRWMVHRPDARAFQKQGVAIATAAGGGMASTTKDLYHSMFFWGYPRIYRMGFAVRAAKPSEIPEDIQKKIHQETDRMAAKIRKNHASFKPTLKTRMWFSMIRWMHKAFWKFEPDYGYWEEHGWHGKNRPWKVKRKKRG